MMDGRRKSDSPVVPRKSSNKAEPATAAETMEGRGPAEGNLGQQNTRRTQDRVSVQSALDRIRLIAKRDKEARFTSLMHHVYAPAALRRAFYALKKDAAAGVDGVTWRVYEQQLEVNLEGLSRRLRCGGYRAKPVRRVFIPKADGRQRPLGVTTLEDKIVQRATVEVLNAIYETDFVGFSYGYRPGRSQHNALDALHVALMTKKVNWVLDADIKSFFDHLDHEHLMRFVEKRIADPRVLRLIRKWLKAGVLEGAAWSSSEEGAPQGGSASPVLSNIFLHYVFDLWAHQWRTEQANGDVAIVRYADDTIVGFESQKDAQRFLSDLKARFEAHGLELHPEKTRLIEFGRFAVQRRRQRGAGKPETFDFLGLTHFCGRARKSGAYTVDRRTIRKRMTAKLHELKDELRRRRRHPVSEQGKWLRSVIMGFDRYHGVPGNWGSQIAFRHALGRLWYQSLRRRGNRRPLRWKRFKPTLLTWFPMAATMHPYPLQRWDVTTRGKSRMR